MCLSRAGTRAPARLAESVKGEAFGLDATHTRAGRGLPPPRRGGLRPNRWRGELRRLIPAQTRAAITDQEWHALLAANLGSAFAVVRAAGLVMAEQGGSVVLVSSAAARIGLANHEAIAAAKAGIEGLALAAAATYAPKGLRVNCVAPGLTRTPLTARLWQNDAVARASAGMHALGRIGSP
ncbi:MAG: SDR family oxidoreductase [Desulfobacterales bacterium]|nr:SDR family oxidoreductase [Desulfobacterales bacterium]